MRTKRVQKLTALVLAVLLLFGGAVTVGASGERSTSGSTLSSIKELLNAISYDEYVSSSDEYKNAVDPTEGFSVDCVGDDQTKVIFTTLGGDEISDKGPVTYAKDQKLPTDVSIPCDYIIGDAEKGETVTKGLFVPETGTISWRFKVEQAMRYNVRIHYYPISNKPAAVERILKINGEVPFAEARYLTISKVWETPYPTAEIEVGKKQSAATIAQEAVDAGFLNVTTSTSEDGKTEYVKCDFPGAWTQKLGEFVDTYTVRFFGADIDDNEIRESLQEAPTWQIYDICDSNGFVQTPFSFVLAPDVNDGGYTTISLEGVNEPIVISKIEFLPPTTYPTYYQYSNQHKDMLPGEGEIKIEAEYFSAVSDQTIYPTSDTTSAATSPSKTDRMYLNVLGGNKWQGVGQWIEYDFQVTKSGMYEIALRHKQNILDGMSVSRTLYLYSDDYVSYLKTGDASLIKSGFGRYKGIPFEEATKIKFKYSDSWQMGVLSTYTMNKVDEDEYEEVETPLSFYFEEGVTYKMRLEVSLGDMGDTIRQVQESLDKINADYLNILKITGTSPDEFVDYKFYEKIPQTMNDMYDQYEILAGIVEKIKLETGSSSSMTATLTNVSDLLFEMSSDEAEVAKNMEQLKTYIGSLGTWLGDAKTQPLLVDYLMVVPKGAELPKAEAGFFASLWHEISGFFQSFFRQYDRMGALTEMDDDASVEVWLAYGRDQSQVIRSLINNDFTKNTGTPVNLKLVAAGTLLPSILAGKGPDVYLGLAAGDVINYAIRGALVPIENLPEFAETEANFNEEAMMVLEIEDKDKVNHCYGLPETQAFTMMFVREDILANLDIEIPKTWDDVKEAIPVLQANNMEIAMSTDSNIFIYQMGGELFADDGMRINLDSNLALEAFNTMCELFTMYSFPYKYDFPNRFRTGEMPIGFADYTATYNHLKVFATELEGLWSFYPMPGFEDEDGNINNDSVSAVTAVVMISGTDKQDKAWEFMKWYVGADCQVEYTNEMVSILGPSAKHPTANRAALESLPWTTEEVTQVKAQFDNLASVPNYPGAYIVARYTNFAFLDAYNDNLNPVVSLSKYIDYINDEITRKRDEFGLETLDKSKQQSTLAVKRLQQAFEALEATSANAASWSNEVITAYNMLHEEIKDYKPEGYSSLLAHAERLESLDAATFGTVITRLREAAVCLQKYEAHD